MTGRGVALARAAEDFAGVRFRLHGRDPATGLDCIGLAVAALDRIGCRVHIPATYGLRNRDIAPLLALAAGAGLAEATGDCEPGDLLLVTPGALQHHLLIAGRHGNFIHAHAGLRRVVAMPGPLSLPAIRHWRLRPSA